MALESPTAPLAGKPLGGAPKPGRGGRAPGWPGMLPGRAGMLGLAGEKGGKAVGGGAPYGDCVTGGV